MVMIMQTPLNNSGTRVRSFDGYEETPIFDTSLIHHIPARKLGEGVGRIIVANERRYSLWSPNSNQVPYYPGPLTQAWDHLGPPSSLPRRLDGHLGPSDPTISPQYFDPSQPWLPFIRKNPIGDQADAAYMAVYNVWSSGADAIHGRLDPTFTRALRTKHEDANRKIRGLKRSGSLPAVLANAPILFPNSEQLAVLDTLSQYEAAVDHVRQSQRLLLKKEAWIDMVEMWLEYPPTVYPAAEATTLADVHHPPPISDDERIGLWINGKEIPWWYLRWCLDQARIPCFIIQEVKDNVEAEDDFEQSTSFVTGTAIETLMTHYTYDERVLLGTTTDLALNICSRSHFPITSSISDTLASPASSMRSGKDNVAGMSSSSALDLTYSGAYPVPRLRATVEALRGMPSGPPAVATAPSFFPLVNEGHPIDLQGNIDQIEALSRQDLDRIMARRPLVFLLRDFIRIATPQQYLNDTLIELGLRLLLEDFTKLCPTAANRFFIFSPFFYTKLIAGGYDHIRTWTKFRLFETQYILVPINDALLEHWYIAIIHLSPVRAGNPASLARNGTDSSEARNAYVWTFDSDGCEHPDVINALQVYMGSVSKDQGITVCKSVGKSVMVPRQVNSYDCGVHLLRTAQRFLWKADYYSSLLTAQGDIPMSEWNAVSISSLRQALFQRMKCLADLYSPPSCAAKHQSKILQDEEDPELAFASQKQTDPKLASTQSKDAPVPLTGLQDVRLTPLGPRVSKEPPDESNVVTGMKHRQTPHPVISTAKRLRISSVFSHQRREIDAGPLSMPNGPVVFLEGRSGRFLTSASPAVVSKSCGDSKLDPPVLFDDCNVALELIESDPLMSRKHSGLYQAGISDDVSSPESEFLALHDDSARVTPDETTGLHNSSAGDDIRQSIPTNLIEVYDIPARRFGFSPRTTTTAYDGHLPVDFCARALGDKQWSGLQQFKLALLPAFLARLSEASSLEDVPRELLDLRQDDADISARAWGVNVRLETLNDQVFHIIQSRSPGDRPELHILLSSAATTLEIVRQSWGFPCIQEIISQLVNRGAEFRLCRRGSFDHLSHPRHYQTGPGVQPVSHNYTRVDYLAYETRRDRFLNSSRGRTARFAGGIVSRLARNVADDVDICATSGPSDEVFEHGVRLWDGQSQTAYWDDALTPEEINLICGVLTVDTGGRPAKLDTKEISWWPKPSAFSFSGLNIGWWSSDCERWFQQRLLEIENNQAKLWTNAEWKRNLRFTQKSRKIAIANEALAAGYLRSRLFQNLIT